MSRVLYAWVAALSLCAVLCAGCGPHHVTSPPPAFSGTPAARPVIHLQDGTVYCAGTAFEVEMDGSAPVVLTALHLFGPAGGLPADIPPDQLAKQVTGLELYNMDASRKVGDACAELSREGYPFGSRGADCLGDLVVFSGASQTGLQVLPLAATDPPAGSDLWLVGKANGQPGASWDLYPATVAEERTDGLAVTLDRAVDTQGMSGCPAVNSRGEVIGMVLGTQTVFGTTFILLNPVSSIRAHLRAIH